MGTKFGGFRSGFNRTGKNDVTPNFLGAPTTKFKGRSAMPGGPFKKYPGEVGDIERGNKRLAKSTHGAGGGMTTRIHTRTGFDRGGNKRGK